MLDFYFCDDAGDFDSPDESCYCGSLSLAEHNLIQNILQECERHGCGVNMFTDVTLSPQQVMDAVLFFERSAANVANSEATRVYQAMLSTLREAAARKTGIHGFAD